MESEANKLKKEEIICNSEKGSVEKAAYPCGLQHDWNFKK